jgi:hypothetical protein
MQVLSPQIRGRPAQLTLRPPGQSSIPPPEKHSRPPPAASATGGAGGRRGRPSAIRARRARRQAVDFLEITLNGSASNRSGLGARVTVQAGQQRYTQVHDRKSGCLSQGPCPLYYDPGDAEQVDPIEVQWPPGSRQVVSGPVATNVRLHMDKDWSELRRDPVCGGSGPAAYLRTMGLGAGNPREWWTSAAGCRLCGVPRLRPEAAVTLSQARPRTGGRLRWPPAGRLQVHSCVCPPRHWASGFAPRWPPDCRPTPGAAAGRSGNRGLIRS